PDVGIPTGDPTGRASPPLRTYRAAVNPPRPLTPSESSRLAFIGLVAAAAFFDFLIVPVLSGLSGPEGAVVVSFIVGVSAGQLAALACWLVCSDGSFLHRLVVHWSTGGILLLCFSAGLFAASPPSSSISQTEFLE